MDKKLEIDWDNLGDRLKVRHPDFSPAASLDGKSNYKRALRIERDGSLTSRVFLDVPDSAHREMLIAVHYLRHLIRNFIQDDVGVRFLSRDAPWDFEIALSTNDTFNLEITSIADNEHQFVVNSREERLAAFRELQTIRLRDLRKLEYLFPDPELAATIASHEAAGLAPDAVVDNPFHGERHIIFSHLPEPEHGLDDAIRYAVQKKVEKNHPGKERTVLVLDNRTSAFDAPEYRAAAEALTPFLEQTAFPEIWFYTGYCSDDDGNNAEFSFAPLKLTGGRRDQYQRLATSNIDSTGRIIW